MLTRSTCNNNRDNTMSAAYIIDTNEYQVCASGNDKLTEIAMKKLRIVILGFGTARQKTVLE
jgi:hypothetical protein